MPDFETGPRNEPTCSAIANDCGKMILLRELCQHLCCSGSSPSEIAGHLLIEIPLRNAMGKPRGGDRYKIIDTGVAEKSRCVAGIGHIA